MRARRILILILLLLSIVWIGTIYAFVLDCEPLTAVDHYEHERSDYEHSFECFPDRDYPSFPDFESWLAENQQKEDRMHEWLANIAEGVAEGSAVSFDPWYDTRDSQGASAPDNWARGERD